MGVGVPYDISLFDTYFYSLFDKYDFNHDGKLSYECEFKPMIDEMCGMIGQRYGYGETLNKIRSAWYSMDLNRDGFIERGEFYIMAKNVLLVNHL